MTTGFQTLGEKIKLWSSNLGQPVHKSVVIDCHGEQTLRNKAFNVPPNMEVLFYVPQGHILNTTFQALANQKQEPVETISAGSKCPNYDLTKVAGYHKDSPLVPLVTKFLHNLKEKCSSGKPVDPYEKIKTNIDNKLTIHDVVTIRYRPFRGESITLSEVVSLLSGLNYYTSIHCSFCRCSTLSVYCFGCAAPVTTLRQKPNVREESEVKENSISYSDF